MRAIIRLECTGIYPLNRGPARCREVFFWGKWISRRGRHGRESISEAPRGQRSADLGTAPYGGVVAQVVAKIKGEPFLFVIALAALLIGLAVLAAGLGTPALRFTITVIAALAFLVILGYYVLEGLRVVGRPREQGLPVAPPSAPAAPAGRQISGKIKVEELSGGAELKGVRAPAPRSRARGTSWVR